MLASGHNAYRRAHAAPLDNTEFRLAEGGYSFAERYAVVRPCVAVCLVEQYSRSSARNQLASGALVEEAADLAGFAVELDADDAVVERTFVGVDLAEADLGL